MHGDAFYTIGSSHVSCQDYALWGHDANARAHAIVADGCSSSLQSDVGARLLAHSVAQVARRGEQLVLPHAVEYAARAAAQLGLRPTCLDATLAVASETAETTKVVMAGDGGIVARRHDGRLDSWSIRFDGSAPAYPSYLANTARLTQYMSSNPMRTIEHWHDDELIATGRGSLRDDPYVFELELAHSDYSTVLLLSDGAQSFHDKRGQRLPLPLVAAQLAAFRSHTGKFVTRRARRFVKTSRRRDIVHRDDLAVAALCNCSGGAT